jgi:hypothetical protein
MMKGHWIPAGVYPREGGDRYDKFGVGLSHGINVAAILIVGRVSQTRRFGLPRRAIPMISTSVTYVTPPPAEDR